MKYLKLRGRIKEKGLTEQDFARKLNLSRTSLSLRLNGKTAWNLPETQVSDYFFNK